MEEIKKVISDDLENLRINHHNTEQKKSKKAKWPLLIIIFILIVSLGLITGFRYLNKPKVVEVVVVRSAHDELNTTVLTAAGYVEAPDRITVRAKIVGRIELLRVDEGDYVESGQLVAKLDTKELQAQVEKAAADLLVAERALVKLEAGSRQEEKSKARAFMEKAKAAFFNAERDLHRRQSLFDQELISQQELDRFQTQYVIAKAEYEVAVQQLKLVEAGSRKEDILIAQAQVGLSRANLKLAQTQLDNAYIKAPNSGTVLEKFVEQGDTVFPNIPPNNGAIISLADILHVRVRVDINELDITKVEIDQPAKITPDADSNKSYEGTVSKISPKSDERTNQVEVKIKLNEPDYLLKPEMSVKVTIIKKDSPRLDKAILFIPINAVYEDGNKQWVFIVKESKAHLCQVHTGKISSGKVEIKSGLESGQMLVVKGYENLKDGDDVLVNQEGHINL